MKSLLPPEWQHSWSIRDNVPRSERFKELAFAGYQIPRCGSFKNMSRLGVPLVVYTDEYAHCGEGKFLYRPGNAVVVNLDAFASEYMPYPNSFHPKQSRSKRFLVVGTTAFELEYYSETNWQSNVEGEFQLLNWNSNFGREADLFQYPMYAVDFVGIDGCTAIDLNTCPGVPVEVVNLVGRDVLTESVRRFCESLAPRPA